ncbi:MAG: polysaccharide biosynthesis protein [Acidobacteriales bacterium]|nr:polysaccharide biosynthesis protein [Terriglobales bacterium]
MKLSGKLKDFVLRHRGGFIHAGLAGGIVSSLVMAFLLRFDFQLTLVELEYILAGSVIALPVKMTCFYVTRLHQGWWSTVSVSDMVRIGYGNLLASCGFALGTWVMVGQSFPRSIYVIDFALSVLGISGAHVLIRIYRQSRLQYNSAGGRKNLLIYGAGWAGVTITREIQENPGLGLRVLGFLDDNPLKKLDLVGGRLVFGTGEEAKRVVEKQVAKGRRIDEILIAMPSANSERMRKAIANCREAGVFCRTLPAIGELLQARSLSRQIRDISVEDLLCRAPVELENAEVRNCVTGRNVLVTGAAGSIGSELCRQLAEFSPSELIALDQAESELFNIDLELRGKHAELKVIPVLANIRDASAMEAVFSRHRVHLVYHAAAYKHVPLMEAHAIQAAQNNVLGMWNVARAALRHHVDSFVQISTDKAVNPTSVMGATKRAAEVIAASLATLKENGHTKFVSVRFGNVLGSSGSVVPVFQAQIACGGPVTVTHPEMRRYFMTTREAVQLVLQASTFGSGPEIFVLDMGEPVEITELARTMIQLAGLVPDRDIKIEFSGLRPGEKLFEEITTQGEHILPTEHPKIKIFKHPPTDYSVVSTWVQHLDGLVARGETDEIIQHLRRLLPEYRPFEQGDASREPVSSAT